MHKHILVLSFDELILLRLAVESKIGTLKFWSADMPAVREGLKLELSMLEDILSKIQTAMETKDDGGRSDNSSVVGDTESDMRCED